MPLSSSLPIWCSLQARKAPPAWETMNSCGSLFPPDWLDLQERHVGAALTPMVGVVFTQKGIISVCLQLSHQDADSKGAICPLRAYNTRGQEMHNISVGMGSGANRPLVLPLSQQWQPHHHSISPLHPEGDSPD